MKISLNDVNDVPRIPKVVTVEVAENSVSGARVGDLLPASDDDALDTLSFGDIRPSLLACDDE